MRKHFKYLLIGIMTLSVGFLTLNKQVVKANGNETIEFSFEAYENDEPEYLNAIGIPTAQTHPKGVKVAHIPVPMSPHYSFAGWWYDNGIQVVRLKVGDVFVDDVTFMARWEITPHFITYELNGGTNSLDNIRVFNATEEVDLLPAHKEGFTFAGWYNDSNFSGQPIDKIEKGSTSIKLYAKYEGNEYTVTFKDHLNNIIELPQLVSHGAAAVAPVPPIRPGYIFDGWDKAFNNVTMDLVVTATYISEKFIVVFKDFDGSVIDTVENVEYGEFVNFPNDPVRVGHTFIGWNYNTSNVTSNMTVTAQYSVNQYTITFDTDGGSPINSITLDYGSEILFASEPTKTGHTFDEWDTVIPATMPAEDLVIKALWTVNKYNVTFKVEGNQYGEILNLEYGSSIPKPQDPTVEGKTFNGWLFNENIFDFDLGTVIADDMVLTAGFDLVVYNVTFKVDGVTLVVREVTHGGNAELPLSPTKNGYTFTSWDGSHENISANITLNAQWSLDSYDITYVLYDVEPNDPATWAPKLEVYDVELADLVLNNPSDRTSSVFVGWFEENDFSGNQITDLEGYYRNITLYAKWETRSHTITFDDNLIDPIQVLHGEFITVLPEPELVGHEFQGWYYEIEIDGITYEQKMTTNIEITKDYFVYPIWIETDLSFDVLVKIKVELPSYTPEDDDIYLAHNLNQWKSNDPNFKLSRVGNIATIEFTIRVEEGFDFQYKFTRGTWESVEYITLGQYQDEQEENKDDNRHYIIQEDTLIMDLETIPLVVPSWADNNVIFTAEMTFTVNLPENTPEDDDIYLVGKFNDWTPSEDYKLNRVGNVATGTFNISYGGIDNKDFQYKFVRGTVEDFDYEFINTGTYKGPEGTEDNDNRHYVFNVLTPSLNINSNVFKWNKIDEFYVDFVIEVEDSRENIYVAGNFDEFNDSLPNWRTGWQVDAIKVEKVDENLSRVVLRLKVKVGDIIEYKFTFDNENSWEELFGAPEGVANRSYEVRVDAPFVVLHHINFYYLND